MGAIRCVSVVVLVGLGVSGCATAYGPMTEHGGYRDRQVGPNIWTVNFNGNGFSDPQQVKEFALLRSAEVTLQNGYRYFVILGKADETGYSYETRYTQPCNRCINTPTEEVAIAHPAIADTIACFKEPPTPGDPVATPTPSAASTLTPSAASTSTSGATVTSTINGEPTTIATPNATITRTTTIDGVPTTTVSTPGTTVTRSTANGVTTITIATPNGTITRTLGPGTMTFNGIPMNAGTQAAANVGGRKVYDAESVASQLYSKWGIQPAHPTR